MAKNKSKKTKKALTPIRIGEDYIKIQRKLNREIELERNGGHWVAVRKVHKSKKDYNRKRGRKVDLNDSCPYFYAQPLKSNPIKLNTYHNKYIQYSNT